jgi:photosystem II stability/assembly factor-like uncharacterized protein
MRVRLLLPLLLLLATAPAAAGPNRWTPYGPQSTGVADIVLDPRSPATRWIAVGTVYKSEDGGASFHPSANGIENVYIRFLAIDPGQPDVLYAATADTTDEGRGVYRSQDGGAHWTLVAGGGDFMSIWSFAVAPGPPGAPGMVFVGTDERVYRSIDGGTSFQAVLTLDYAGLFEAVAPDPRNPGTVYAADLFERFKSTDFGVTWTDIVEDPEGFPFVHDFVVAPGDPRTLYETGDGANVGATWRSRDGGATWQGPFPFRGDVLAVDPVDSNTVYGGSFRGLFVSRDGGETFTEATRGVPPLDIDETYFYGVYSIKTDPARPGYALACTAQGLFETVDRGRTWHAAPLGGLIGNPIAGFRIDPYDPAHWILSSFGIFYESHDRGATFQLLADSVQRQARIYTLEFDPFVRDRLWALAVDPAVNSALYLSTNGGATWYRHGDAPYGGALLLPEPRVILLVGNGIYRSGDAGRTWRFKARFSDFLLQDPRNPRTIYEANGYFRSVDGGHTWQPWFTESNSGVIGFDPFRPRTVHLVRDHDLLVTQDDGKTFRTVGRLPFPSPHRGVRQLLFDRARRGTLYAVTYDDGILRSRDGGVTWEPLNSGLPAPDPYFGGAKDLIQDPIDSRRFYATPATGLYRADFTGDFTGE